MIAKENEIPIARNIATEVRKWVSGTYVKNFENFGSDLAGLCAIASYHLFKALRTAGINCWFVINKWNSHSFVLLENDMVIDITATQFSYKTEYPDVLIQSIHTLEKTWDIGCKAQTELGIARLIKKWPKSQQPEISI
jgi:hypothetical protein